MINNAETESCKAIVDSAQEMESRNNTRIYPGETQGGRKPQQTIFLINKQMNDQTDYNITMRLCFK